MSTPLENYLAATNGKPNAAMCAYVANLQQVAAVGPDIAASIVNELENQRSHLKLVASENYCSLNVQAAMGNLLTDKYAEGYPEHRYYGGCVNIDAVENTAAREAEALFGADYAYVQPHSGADTNLVAYWAILSAKVETPTLEELGVKSLNDLTDAQFDELRKKFGNQKLMGLDYSCGGHLTHGYKMNVSARMFESHPYGVDKETGLLVGFITLIMILVIYLATSLILPLIISSFMTLLMYSAQTGIATAMYQTMMLISNPITIAIGIIGSVIIVSVFTLLGIYIYNILASSNREILVKLSEKNNLTQLDSITPLNFAIAIGAISLILNIIIAAILVISSVPIFNALVDVLIGFVCAFIAAMLIALSYNFLAPKLGKLKVELE